MAVRQLVTERNRSLGSIAHSPAVLRDRRRLAASPSTDPELDDLRSLCAAERSIMPIMRGYQLRAAWLSVTFRRYCGLLSRQAIFRCGDRVLRSWPSSACQSLPIVSPRQLAGRRAAGTRRKRSRAEPTWLASLARDGPQRGELSQAQAQIPGAAPAPSRRRPGHAGAAQRCTARASSRAAAAEY